MAPRAPVYDVFPPKVESRESLDLLLAELARIDALEKHWRADLDREIVDLTNKAAAQMLIPVGPGDPLRLADWRAQLEEAAEKFCAKNRELLLDDKGGKSVQLNHGIVGWKAQRARLEPRGDFEKDGNPVPLAELKEKIVGLLGKATGWFSKAAGFVRIKIEWDKTALLKAFQMHLVDEHWKERTGFKLVDAGDKFFVDVSGTKLESQSAERP